MIKIENICWHFPPTKLYKQNWKHPWRPITFLIFSHLCLIYVLHVFICCTEWVILQVRVHRNSSVQTVGIQVHWTLVIWTSRTQQPAGLVQYSTPKTHIKYKSPKFLVAHNLLSIYLIILTFCTEYSNGTVMLCANRVKCRYNMVKYIMILHTAL